MATNAIRYLPILIIISILIICGCAKNNITNNNITNNMSNDNSSNSINSSYYSGIFNVKNYGVAGNGETDDTKAINAASLDASKCNGIVYFPPGTYIVSSPIIIYPNTTYEGASVASTTLKLANNANTDLFKTYNFDRLTFQNTNMTINGFILEDFTVDGNNCHNSAGVGIKIYGCRYIISNINVCNCSGTGIYSEWSTSADPVAIGMESLWSNVQSFYNNGDGIVFRGPHDTRWNNILTYSNIGNGTRIEQDPTASIYSGSGLEVNTLHSYNNTKTGVYANIASYWVNLESETNGGDGLLICGNDYIINGLDVYNNNLSGITIGEQNKSMGSSQISGKSYNNKRSQINFVNDYGNTINILTWNNKNQTSYTGSYSQQDILTINALGEKAQDVMQGKAKPMISPNLPSGTGRNNNVTNTLGYGVIIYQAGMIGTVIVDPSGVEWPTGVDMTTLYLPPGASVYYTKQVPSGWAWQPMF